MLCCAALAGCDLMVPHSAGKLPLPSLAPDPESVGLEIYSARFADCDKQATLDLWNDVDEQQIRSDCAGCWPSMAFGPA